MCAKVRRLMGVWDGRVLLLLLHLPTLWSWLSSRKAPSGNTCLRCHQETFELAVRTYVPSRVPINMISSGRRETRNDNSSGSDQNEYRRTRPCAKFAVLPEWQGQARRDRALGVLDRKNVADDAWVLRR